MELCSRVPSPSPSRSRAPRPAPRRAAYIYTYMARDGTLCSLETPRPYYYYDATTRLHARVENENQQIQPPSAPALLSAVVVVCFGCWFRLSSPPIISLLVTAVADRYPPMPPTTNNLYVRVCVCACVRVCDQPRPPGCRTVIWLAVSNQKAPHRRYNPSINPELSGLARRIASRRRQWRTPPPTPFFRFRFRNRAVPLGRTLSRIVLSLATSFFFRACEFVVGRLLSLSLCIAFCDARAYRVSIGCRTPLRSDSLSNINEFDWLPVPAPPDRE
jgi:hypothetical protein